MPKPRGIGSRSIWLMESGHNGRKRHFRPSTGTARRFLQMNVGQNMLSRGVNGKCSDQRRVSELVQALLKARLQPELQGEIVHEARLSTSGDYFSRRCRLTIPKLLSKLYVGMQAAEMRLDCPTTPVSASNEEWTSSTSVTPISVSQLETQGPCLVRSAGSTSQACESLGEYRTQSPVP